MGHDVNFNEMSTATEAMCESDMSMCIDNLREIIIDGKAQWDKLAAIIAVDGDDVDAMFAAARMLMAGIGSDRSKADVQKARETFPAFAEMHDHIDAACLYEMERFNRHCDELAAMSVEGFIKFKLDGSVGSAGARRWWRPATKPKWNLWLSRSLRWIAKVIN